MLLMSSIKEKLTQKNYFGLAEMRKFFQSHNRK